MCCSDIGDHVWSNFGTKVPRLVDTVLAGMLLAGLDFGALRVIGIDKQKKYLKIAEKRLGE